MKEQEETLVVFVLARQRYAIALTHVLRVVEMAAWTPIPGAPGIVLGLLNLHGEGIPILDPVQRFAGTRPPFSLSDQLIVVRTQQRKFAILVNEVLGVFQRSGQVVSTSSPAELGSEHYAALAVVNDELVLVHDVEKFLLSDEAQSLEQAVERLRGSILEP